MDEVLDSAQSGGPEGVDFDAIVGVDPLELTDQQRRQWLVHTHKLIARLDAATVAVTGAFDANVDWAADGARSGQSWIAARVPIAHARAHSDVHTARKLRETPKVAAAARAGRISRDQVAALLKARQPGLEDAFALCEEILVDEVTELTVAAAHTFLRRWALDVRTRLGINEPDGKPRGKDSEHSTVHLASTYGGKWDLQGVLDPETGEILANALDHQIDAMWRDGVFHTDDGLCQPERRGKALAELICRATNGGDQDGTARPLVLAITTIPYPDHAAHEDSAHDAEPVDCDAPTSEAPDDAEPDERCCTDDTRESDDGVVDDVSQPTEGDSSDSSSSAAPGHGRPQPGSLLWPTSDSDDADQLDPDIAADAEDALYNFPTQLRISELSRSGPTSAAALHKWICEGDVVPITITPDGDVLRMGRAIRLANRHQRRTLRVRDGGCQFPGCSVAPEYCVPHHLHYWELGGYTDIEDLILLCRFHHDAIHRRGFSMTRELDGTITTRRPERGTITPHLRIRADLLPRPRPSPHVLEMRRRAKARRHALARARDFKWDNFWITADIA